jgi:hypothetical protein
MKSCILFDRWMVFSLVPMGAYHYQRPIEWIEARSHISLGLDVVFTWLGWIGNSSKMPWCHIATPFNVALSV